jgi:hypothetical protein
MTASPKRYRRKVGDVVRIPLANNRCGYARVLEDPLYAYYDFFDSAAPSVKEILEKPVLFKVWTRDQFAIKEGRWQIIGNEPLEVELLEIPRFFKVDPISKKLSIYWKGTEKPATRAECDSLECAAVWDTEHIEDRLNDHLAGKPNTWVESMKPK